jgi:hypothetical protein
MLRLFDEKNGRLLQVRLTLRYAAFFSTLVWLFHIVKLCASAWFNSVRAGTGIMPGLECQKDVGTYGLPPVSIRFDSCDCEQRRFGLRPLLTCLCSNP